MFDTGNVKKYDATSKEASTVYCIAYQKKQKQVNHGIMMEKNGHIVIYGAKVGTLEKIPRVQCMSKIW